MSRFFFSKLYLGIRCNLNFIEVTIYFIFYSSFSITNGASLGLNLDLTYKLLLCGSIGAKFVDCSFIFLKKIFNLM